MAPTSSRVYWRSLRNAPPLSEWLAAVIGFLSTSRYSAGVESERITALLQLLRARRCLLVLDNSETLFEPGQREGRYRERWMATVGSCRPSAKRRTGAAWC